VVTVLKVPRKQGLVTVPKSTSEETPGDCTQRYLGRKVWELYPEVLRKEGPVAVPRGASEGRLGDRTQRYLGSKAW